MITINAHHHCTYDYATSQYTLFPEQPLGVKVCAEFATTEDAKAFAKLFPKYVGLRVRAHTVWGQVWFGENRVTGEKNETGLKRWRKMIAVIEQHGFLYAFATEKCVNGYRDIETFNNALK
jgi:hypothetical protein